MPVSNLLSVSPLEHGKIAERLIELAVIISLMGPGLKLDRPLGLRAWGTTWRLLAVTMPLCIMLLCFGGIYIMGLPLAPAVLLGAVLAPTDPVLASDVQVGPPNEDEEREGPFVLTSEAGLNDGLAFLLLIRPASGALGLIGSHIPNRHKAAIAAYGIRGIGSFYYLAHGLNHCNIAPGYGKTLWAVSAFIVIVSIIVHGATASFAMRRLTRNGT